MPTKTTMAVVNDYPYRFAAVFPMKISIFRDRAVVSYYPYQFVAVYFPGNKKSHQRLHRSDLLWP